LSAGYQLGCVVLIESADNEHTVRGHHLAQFAHVMEQDIPVDVCHHNIEQTVHVREHIHISRECLEILYFVQFGIMAGVLHTPFVNVVAHYFGSARLGGYNTQNACPAAAVEHTLAREVHAQQGAHHQAGGGMATGAERQFGVDYHIHLSFHGLYRMLCVVYHTFAAHNDRLKTVALPILVPVFVFHLLQLISNAHTFNGEIAETAVEHVFVKQCVLYIAHKAAVGCLERLKAGVTGQVGHNLIHSVDIYA